MQLWTIKQGQKDSPAGLSFNLSLSGRSLSSSIEQQICLAISSCVVDVLYLLVISQTDDSKPEESRKAENN